MYSWDLYLLKDFVPVEKTFYLYDKVFEIIGWFPYERARIINNAFFPRVILHDIEYQLQQVHCYDNKYVVAISSDSHVLCYYFHDNDAKIGKVKDLIPYHKDHFDLISRYDYVAYILKYEYGMHDDYIASDIKALKAGKRGVDIGDYTARIIISPFFLKFYGPENEYTPTPQ